MLNAPTVTNTLNFKTVDYDSQYWEPIPLELWSAYMRDGDRARSALILCWAYMDKLKKQSME